MRHTLEQLENLITVDKRQVTMVGMQKRYSPLIRTLKKQLAKTDPISYTLSYHTGLYPEGNPLTDLFIHPVDLVLYLFGNAELKSVQQIDRNGTMTIQGLLSHGTAKGYIELSTAYSWTNPKETLYVNTQAGNIVWNRWSDFAIIHIRKGLPEYRLRNWVCLLMPNRHL